MPPAALATVDRPAWQARGACLGHDDPDIFHERDREEEAVAFCQGCPVRQECLLDALDRGDQNGVWGGTNPEQRAELRRLARRVAAGEL